MPCIVWAPLIKPLFDGQRWKNCKKILSQPVRWDRKLMRPSTSSSFFFARETGKFAAIGSLEQTADLLCGAAGTLITKSATTTGLHARTIVQEVENNSTT